MSCSSFFATIVILCYLAHSYFSYWPNINGFQNGTRQGRGYFPLQPTLSSLGKIDTEISKIEELIVSKDDIIYFRGVGAYGGMNIYGNLLFLRIEATYNIGYTNAMGTNTKNELLVPGSGLAFFPNGTISRVIPGFYFVTVLDDGREVYIVGWNQLEIHILSEKDHVQFFGTTIMVSTPVFSQSLNRIFVTNSGSGGTSAFSINSTAHIWNVSGWGHNFPAIDLYNRVFIRQHSFWIDGTFGLTQTTMYIYEAAIWIDHNRDSMAVGLLNTKDSSTLAQRNISNNQLLWQFNALSPILRGPIVDQQGNSIIATAFQLFIINPTGQELWNISLIDHPITSNFAMLSTGEIVFASKTEIFQIVERNGTCFGTSLRNPNVCSGHGTCVQKDLCKCMDGYTGNACQYAICYGIPSNHISTVCSGNGICVAPNQCDCPGYRGLQCETRTCYEIPFDEPSVCYGHGECVSVNTCHCRNGYSGSQCNFVHCFEISSGNTSFVCSGNGQCIAANTCECETGYFGDNCSAFKCNQVNASSPLVCNGKGKCVGPNVCACDPVQRVGEWYLDEFCTSSMTLLWLLLLLVPLCCLFVLIIWSVLICFCALIVIRKRRNKNQYDTKLLDEEELMEEKSFNLSKTFDVSLFSINFDDIVLIKEIGAGGSGAIVFLGKYHNEFVAVKLFRAIHLSNKDNFDIFLQELKLIANLRHPNIILVYGACMKKNRIGFVSEFCENESLAAYLSKTKNISWKQKLSWIVAICKAMTFIHAKGIIHRDLKCDNVLLDKNLQPKICDFGLSKIVKNSAAMTKLVGTSYYMAPEITRGELHDEKCDVFSFGIMLMEILTQVVNPYANDRNSIVQNIELKVAQNPLFRPQFPPEFRVERIYKTYIHFMQMCWNDDPTCRPSFEVLINVFEKELLDYNS